MANTRKTKRTKTPSKRTAEGFPETRQEFISDAIDIGVGMLNPAVGLANTATKFVTPSKTSIGRQISGETKGSKNTTTTTKNTQNNKNDKNGKRTSSPMYYEPAQLGPKDMKVGRYSTGGSVKGRKKMKDGGNAKPDFLDMDNDGNTTEPMKSAVKQKRDKKMGGGEMLRMKDGGMVDATLDATSDRATNGDVCRGGGAALRGTKFRGVR